MRRAYIETSKEFNVNGLAWTEYYVIYSAKPNSMFNNKVSKNLLFKYFWDSLTNYRIRVSKPYIITLAFIVAENVDTYIYWELGGEIPHGQNAKLIYYKSLSNCPDILNDLREVLK